MVRDRQTGHVLPRHQVFTKGISSVVIYLVIYIIYNIHLCAPINWWFRHHNGTCWHYQDGLMVRSHVRLVVAVPHQSKTGGRLAEHQRSACPRGAGWQCQPRQSAPCSPPQPHNGALPGQAFPLHLRCLAASEQPLEDQTQRLGSTVSPRHAGQSCKPKNSLLQAAANCS